MKPSTVNKRIAAQGLQWTAGETSKSHLTKRQILKGASGVIRDPAVTALSAKMFSVSNSLQKKLELVAKTPGPDKDFNWLNKKGIVSSPKDQNPGGIDCNSCVAFAVVSAVEARMNIQTNQTVADDVNLSEGYLFFRGCGFCCDRGWFIPEALDKCIELGLPSEQSFSYNPSQSTRPDFIQPIVRLKSKSKVANDSEIRRIIATKGPVVAEMDLHSDFTTYTTGVYEPSDSSVITTHAVCLLGYDDSSPNPHWIGKNSWGTNWGDGGFFKIRMGACGIAVKHLVWDFDLLVHLSLAQATSALQDIVAKAMKSDSLKLCIVSTLTQDISGPQCSTIEEAEVTQFVIDILNSYPDLISIVEPLFQ